MIFFTEFRTEIKILLIVVLAAVVIAVGGILLLKGFGPNQVSPTPAPSPNPSSQPQPFTTDVESEVTVTTDKSSYVLGEVVKILVQNNLSQSIGHWDYSGQYNPQFALQYFDNGTWDNSKESKSVCACNENCTTYANGWLELQAGSTITDSWDTQEDCTGVVVRQGRYRIAFSYSLDLTSQGESNTIYSDEFEVRWQATEGWQTYRNDEFGFELQYPSEWRVSDCIGREAEEGKAVYADIVIGPYGENACMVEVPYASSPELSFVLDIREQRDLDKTCGYGEELQKNIPIANKESPLCSGVGPGPGEFHITSWANINGKHFLFWGNSRGAGELGESHEEFQSVFEQMLVTFRFTP